MAINFTSGLFQGLDDNGDFVPYGLVYFTDPNTGDPIQTYSDSGLTVPNTHPVVLSPSGKAYIIVPDATTADIRFADANDVTIWFLESYDVTDQTAIDNISAALVQTAADVVTANDYVLDAGSWANEDEDVPVKVFTNGVGAARVPTVYSARHWETKAAEAEIDVEEAAASAAAAEQSEWESEASRLTSESYAVEPEDTFVNIWTSDGDGTYTATPTTDYSALHWAAKAEAIAGGTLDALSDVNMAGKADTDLITWDAGTNKYIALTRANLFLGITTAIPTLVFTTPVDENSTDNLITITVEENATPSLPLSDVGTCKTLTNINTTTWTALFDAKDITDTDDDNGTITCDAINTYEGKLRSTPSSDAITITFIPSEADTAESDNLSVDTINDGYAALDAGGRTSTKDRATRTSPLAIQGEMTISNSLTTSVQCTEDITGLTTIYIINTENPTMTAVLGAVSGSVGTQVFTYTTPLLSAATEASSENYWLESASSTLSTVPTELTVSASSTTTALITLETTITGEVYDLYNGTDGGADGYVPTTLGAVTTVGDNDGANNVSTTDATPTMTSNTAPSGIAFAIGSTVPTNAFNAFNGSATDISDIPTSTTATLTVGFILDTPTVINKVRWGSLTTQYAESGTVEISTDTTDGTDGTWTQVGAWSGYTALGAAGWNPYFTFVNGVSAKGIRLNGDSSGAGGVNMYFTEIEFIANATPVSSSAVISGLTVKPAKAFKYDKTDLSLCLEDTEARIVNEVNSYKTIDATTASDGSNVVSTYVLVSGERIVVDGVDELGGVASSVEGPPSATDQVFYDATETVINGGTLSTAFGTFSSDFTICGFFTVTDTDYTNLVFGDSNTYMKIVSDGTDYQFTHYNGATTSTVDNTTPIITGTEFFMCAKVTGNEMFLQINTTTATFTKSIAFANGTNLLFGRDGVNASQNMNGSSREVFVFDRALTPTEIEEFRTESSLLYTLTLPNHTTVTTTPTEVYTKGGKDLTFVSSTTTEYVGTNAVSGLIKTGDTIQLDGATEVVSSLVVESPAGTYTITIPLQASPPASAKVLDRCKKLSVTSKLFDGTKFNYTYGSYVKNARHYASKLESSTSGTKVIAPIISQMNKAG